MSKYLAVMVFAGGHSLEAIYIHPGDIKSARASLLEKMEDEVITEMYSVTEEIPVFVGTQQVAYYTLTSYTDNDGHPARAEEGDTGAEKSGYGKPVSLTRGTARTLGIVK